MRLFPPPAPSVDGSRDVQLAQCFPEAPQGIGYRHAGGTSAHSLVPASPPHPPRPPLLLEQRAWPETGQVAGACCAGRALVWESPGSGLVTGMECVGKPRRAGL